MWPFRKRAKFEEARNVLWDFHDRMSWSQRQGICQRTNASLCWSVEKCLRMMLGREPRQEEVIEVVEAFVPFWSKPRPRGTGRGGK